MSGTDPDGKRRPIDRTQPFVPPAEPTMPAPADNLPKVPGITLHFELARGGMGVVYSGRQDFLDRRVAVKLLSVELGGDSFVQRFQREAKILAGIKHPNIVACHMAGQTDDGQSYLVMEFIDGPTLKKWVADHGPLSVPAALRLTRAVGQALGHAMSLGIIHRDVKPENILLETVTSTALDVGFPFTPKLVDLGLARASSGSASLGLTSPGSVMGTPATMSPEQYDEPDGVDFRSDIYGLGCALYEMLVGQPAFRAKKLSEIVAQKRRPEAPNPCAENSKVPPEVGALVQCMLACDREHRPASYKELDERIADLLDTMVAQRTRPGGRQRTGATTAPKPPEPPPASPQDDLNSTLPFAKRPTAPPKEPLPRTTAPKQPTAPPAGPNTSGPGLLRTAEINFLAEGLEARAATPNPAFQSQGTMVVEQAANATPAAPRPAPAKSRTGLLVGAAVLLVGGGVAFFALPGGEQPGDGGGGGATSNTMPKIVSVEAPSTIEVGKPFRARVVASDAEGDKLTYAWSWPEQVLRASGPSSGAEIKLDVYDGLPGLEVPLTVEVSDQKGLPAKRVVTLGIGTAPVGWPVLGFRTNPAWNVDKTSAWTSIEEAKDPAVSCLAKKERRTLGTSLGDDAYWEWFGSLESREDQGTAFAKVGIRFQFGDRAWLVQCQRSERDGKTVHTTEVLACQLRGDTWMAAPLEPALRHELTEPVVPDDAEESSIAEYRGWFSVQRRNGELVLQVGAAKRAPSDKEEQVVERTDARSFKIPSGDVTPQVELIVDQGIGRFRVQKR